MYDIRFNVLVLFKGTVAIMSAFSYDLACHYVQILEVWNGDSKE